MDALGSQTADLWKKLYETAINEPDRPLQMQRLLEAERAILERALFLDEQEYDGPEVTALERAGDSVREMKLKTGSNGGRQAGPGSPMI